MKYLIVLILLSATSFSTKPYKDMDTKEYFCGENLPRTLSNFCLIRATPINQRRKRGIAEECCLEPCSRSHMLQNYCSQRNQEYIEKFIETYKSNVTTENIIYENKTNAANNGTSIVGDLNNIGSRIVDEISNKRYQTRIVENLNSPSEGFISPKVAGVSVTVTVPVGTLNGKVAAARVPERTPAENLVLYYSFQKVPYAEPPVGNLRFQAPVPKRNSTIHFNNTSVDYMCFQLGQNKIGVNISEMVETEDCLYLNIYTPQLPAQTNNPLLPVFVFYHGGGFIQGFTSEKILGPDFLIQKNILVVTINYRLGPFGFLSTGDTVIPGNAGLKDQLLGLKWVSENIHYFGGDPSKITIGGESEGAASAVLLMLNKEAKGLFRGVIAQSGSALQTWAYQRHPRKIAFELAENINKNFTSNSSEELRDFLLQAEPEQIITSGLKLSPTREACLFGKITSFAPVVEVKHEGAFLTEENRYELMKSGNISQVPILTGFTSEEILFLIKDRGHLVKNLEDIDIHIEKLIPSDLKLRSDLNVSEEEVAIQIRNIYIEDDLSWYIPFGVRLCSDIIFTNAVINTAQLLSKWSDVYLYQFSYSGNITEFKKIELISGAEKVPHFSDHFYIWRAIVGEQDTADYSRISENDRLILEQTVKLWTNFIKYLNPTPPGGNTEVLWTPTNSQGNDTLLYLNINTTFEMLENPRGGVYKSWNLIYEQYAGNSNPKASQKVKNLEEKHKIAKIEFDNFELLTFGLK